MNKLISSSVVFLQIFICSSFLSLASLASEPLMAPPEFEALVNDKLKPALAKFAEATDKVARLQRQSLETEEEYRLASTNLKSAQNTPKDALSFSQTLKIKLATTALVAKRNRRDQIAKELKRAGEELTEARIELNTAQAEVDTLAKTLQPAPPEAAPAQVPSQESPRDPAIAPPPTIFDSQPEQPPILDAAAV